MFSDFGCSVSRIPLYLGKQWLEGGGVKPYFHKNTIFTKYFELLGLCNNFLVNFISEETKNGILILNQVKERGSFNGSGLAPEASLKTRKEKFINNYTQLGLRDKYSYGSPVIFTVVMKKFLCQEWCLIDK